MFIVPNNIESTLAMYNPLSCWIVWDFLLNVQLQEQIVRLKEELVELDTVRHENKALIEEKEIVEAQITEISTLKRIVEKQLEESLNSIREEREHKYQRKRESHERKEKQSLQELKNLAHNLNQDMLYEIDDDDDDELRAEQLGHGQRYIIALKSYYYYYYYYLKREIIIITTVIPCETMLHC